VAGGEEWTEGNVNPLSANDILSKFTGFPGSDCWTIINLEKSESAVRVFQI